MRRSTFPVFVMLALLFIVFVLAEIRNVLVYNAPYGEEPISIWEESQKKHPPQDLSATNMQ